jgi:L-asparaginase II
MLAASVHLGLDPRGYERPDHEVQIMIAGIISEACGIALDPGRMAVDGCSVPTWSLPLSALAQGFARLGSGQRLPQTRARAAERLRRACFAAPVLVAGEGRFDTIAMAGLAPNVLSKGGPEGVHCAALPELGLGIALKIDDGAKRGAERALAEVVAALLPRARSVLAGQLEGGVFNWRGINVGRIAASDVLLRALAALGAAPRGLGAAHQSLF